MQRFRAISFATTMLAAAWCFAQAPASLKIASPVTAEFEDGPPLGAMRLRPGEIVYFSFVAENYARAADLRVDLTARVQVFDPRGTPIYPVDEIPILTRLTEEDKNWVPKFRSAVAIPPIAPPGAYRIKFSVTDNQSHQSASGETTFEVEAKAVAPADTLTIRELNFFHAQEDTTPLITPVFRAGDMFWVKFYITGYKYGEQNAIDTSYDVELLGPDGASIMKKEDAAMEKSTAWYPQPYIPAIFNLTLKSTTPHEVYTLVVTAHDHIGNQTAESKSKYRVN